MDGQVDELLARVEPADLLHISSGQVSSRAHLGLTVLPVWGVELVSVSLLVSLFLELKLDSNRR